MPAGDRASLERLARYVLRPPLSLKRLSLREDGAVVYSLQRPDRRGRTALVMAPVEFLARLAAILPAPRLALRRQLGAFASGSPDRRKVMPAPALRQGCHPAKLPHGYPGPSSCAGSGTSRPCAAIVAMGGCGRSPLSRISPRWSGTSGTPASSRPFQLRLGRAGLLPSPDHRSPPACHERLRRRDAPVRPSCAGVRSPHFLLLASGLQNPAQTAGSDP